MRHHKKPIAKNHPFFKPKTQAQVVDRGAEHSYYQQAYDFFMSNDLALAEQAILKALTIQPKSIEYLNLQSVIYSAQTRFELAESVMRKIVHIDPTQTNTWSNLGSMCSKAGRYPEAVQYLLKALTLEPQHFNTIMNLAVTYGRMGERTHARQYYDKAIELNPNDAQLHFNKGCSYQDDFEYGLAVQSFERSLALDPSQRDARTNLLFLQYYQLPFDAQNATQKAKALGQILSQQTNKLTLTAQLDDPLRRPLRVGLVSGDLRRHPVSHFLKPLLPHIDTTQIQLFAYANHVVEDEISKQLKPYFYQWLNVHAIGDDRMAEKIQTDQIDILIDLSGHTDQNRLPVFARKPAPVQMAWLGYFATTGLPEMDYILADAICVPPSEEALFSEQVWRMPHSRLPLYRPDIIHRSPLPCLSQSHFTFACFQNLGKVNDQVLHTWGQILSRAPKARLRLQGQQLSAQTTQDQLMTRMRAQGIDTERVSLHASQPYSEFIASHAQIDVLLDTFPYPGGTTTVASLWQGVPTITLTGSGMLARQGEQLLRSAGLDDWVCHSVEEYIEKAVDYANNQTTASEHAPWQALAQLRQSLPEQLAKRPAADAASFARDWGNALQAIWQHAHSEKQHQPTKA